MTITIYAHEADTANGGARILIDTDSDSDMRFEAIQQLTESAEIVGMIESMRVLIARGENDERAVSACAAIGISVLKPAADHIVDSIESALIASGVFGDSGDLSDDGRMVITTTMQTVFAGDVPAEHRADRATRAARHLLEYFDHDAVTRSEHFAHHAWLAGIIFGAYHTATERGQA